MKEIPLTRGLVALVDDEDFEELSRYSWTADADGYAVRSASENEGGTQVKMHRQLLGLGAADFREGDHRNGVVYDNQKHNLRACSHAENIRNGKHRVNNTSGYKGVSLFKRTGRWAASIEAGKGKQHLGYFDTPEAAHIAYKAAADRYHGEFANYGRSGTEKEEK